MQELSAIFSILFLLIRKTLIVIVMTVFWARVLCHLVVEEARFKMRVTLEAILIRSLAYAKYNSGRLRSGFGVALS